LKLPAVDLSSHNDTLWAVILGALLATASGFLATQLEAWFRRRERERNAALLFGEVLATIAMLLEIADDTRATGDPYGPVTMRMLVGARREIDIYDRNREQLYDLRDAEVRAKLHILVLRLTLPLDGVFDLAAEIATARATVVSPRASKTVRDAATERLVEMEQRIADSFDFVLENAKNIEPLVARLRPIARHTFDNYGRVRAAATTGVVSNAASTTAKDADETAALA
jgi:hypothetical protein